MKRFLSFLISLSVVLALSLPLGAAGSFGDADIDDHSDHLTAYWRVEETGAADRVDDVGSNDLAATNTPATRAGISNNACDFIAASTELLSKTHVADLSATTGFAVSMWVELDDTSSNMMLWAKGTTPYVYRTTSNTLVAFLLETDEGNVLTTASDNIGDGIHHIVAIAADSFLRLYINGAEASTATAWDDTLKQSEDPFYIGCWGSLSLYLDGGADEIGYWKDISFTDQAEREAFVEALYNSGTGTFYVIDEPSEPVLSNKMTAGAVQDKVTAGVVQKIYTAQ